MNVADLSLDEIIARQKKKKGGAKRDGNSSNRSLKQRGRGFSREFASTDATFTRSGEVPDGKWGHDGFEEMYGNGSTRPSKAPIVRGGAKSFSRSMLNRKVKLHITNLAPTVNTADLNELFESFPVDSVIVHYDELGQSVGTADVVTDRASAEEIKSNFSGVALDGSTMHMFIIDESTEDAPVKSIRERLSVGKRPIRISRGIMKRKKFQSFREPRGEKSRAIRQKSQKFASGRERMTDAELDKELEEYMKKGSSAQTMES